ncbi:MAG: zinc dependent phospholipase C family protein [Rhodospirillaceae bacterium]
MHNLPAWASALLFAFAVTALSQPAAAWENGPPNNKVTNTAEDCANPPYSTHDWIAEHALNLLPANERAWLEPHKRLLLIGTEAPDYNKIPLDCGVPNQGYDDNGKGRHDIRFDGKNPKVKPSDHPAQRAQDEVALAADAFRDGKYRHAAYFLGAAIHYIGDLAQYGHTIFGEKHHTDFELWVGGMTLSYSGGGVFEKFIKAAPLEPKSAYDAVWDTGAFTYAGVPPVMKSLEIDRRFNPDRPNDPEIVASVGTTLNKAVNEAAAMLHDFYVTVVKVGE